MTAYIAWALLGVGVVAAVAAFAFFADPEGRGGSLGIAALGGWALCWVASAICWLVVLAGRVF